MKYHAQQAIQKLADSMIPFTNVRTVPVQDLNSTFVMNTIGDFFCTHDGSDHVEIIIETVWSPALEDSVDVMAEVTICDSCGRKL